VKLKKGDAVLYPSGYLHEVKKITKGVRICAVTWIQSGIRDEQKRDIIFDLLKLGNKLAKSDLETQNLVSKIRNNLTREWCEF
jgi:PKHD-type hydroxylase